MKLAILAHDSKKELLAQFCSAYCGILSQHTICATSVTAKYIVEATGLEVDELMSGESGGNEQIAQRIAYDEIDMLIYIHISLIKKMMKNLLRVLMVIV